MRHLKILILLLLCLAGRARAQDKLLEQTVSIHYVDAKLRDVLLGLESKYGIQFYYASNLVPLNKRVTVNIKNQPFTKALEQVLEGSEVEYVLAGDKVVLRRLPTPKPKKSSKREQSLPDNSLTASADIRDLRPAFSLAEVRSVPVVNEATFSLASLEHLPTSDSVLSQKTLSETKSRLFKSYIAKMDSLGKIGDMGSMDELKAKFSASMNKLNEKIKALAKTTRAVLINEDDSTQTKSNAQLSFVYPIGTNGVEGANMVNRTSVNVLTGYAKGLEGVEAAGLVNVNETYVHGAQFAGAVNTNKQEMKGIQGAGVANVVGKNVKGAQFAGVANVTSGQLEGVQGSGVLNLARKTVVGFQSAGVANVAGDSSMGLQAAGVTNIVDGSFLGTQFAGVANINDGSFNGFQAAGVANINEGPARGVQVASILNYTREEHNGVQISGVLNKAKRVRGSQIGLVNMADTVTGVTLGLINLVKNGYNKLEIYGSEALYGNVAFRFGSQKFHTIAAVGIQPSSKSADFRLGYGGGFGSAWNVSPRSLFNFDLMALHIQEGTDDYTNKLNLLCQLKASFVTKLAGKLYVFAGPTFNVMVSQHFDKTRGAYGSQLMPSPLFDETETIHRDHGDYPTNVKGWVGFNAGIRF
jgi:hypothetical protein